MIKCEHCGSNEETYVMLYEKDGEQPAKIDLWAMHNDEPVCVGSVTTIKVNKGVELKPIFFCANCHSLIPWQYIRRSLRSDAMFGGTNE